MSDAESSIRKRVRYAGRVQGVGFRYTTQMLAGRFPVVGYVKNMPDGAVELEVEGARDACERFLGAVADHFRTHIQDAVTQEISPRGRDAGFEIRY